MNHPKHEEWVPYLFGESKTADRHQLDHHLQSCAECREEVAAWKRSLGRLDAWKLPKAEQPRESVAPLLKWAVAAAVALVLGVGFSIGRLTSASADVEKVRAAIEPRLRQELRQEFAQALRSEVDKAAAATLAAADKQTEVVLDYAETLETRHGEDTQAIYAALDKLYAQRLADYLALKQDVDTVALATDAGLRRTEQQLVQLADYSQPVSFPNSPQK
jgi:hypothetical protein